MLSPSFQHTFPVPENAQEEFIVRQWNFHTIPSFRAYNKWYTAFINKLDIESTERSMLQKNVVDMWLKTCCSTNRTSTDLQSPSC